MGSIFQSTGLEQTDPQKNKAQLSNERESTIAHLLIASGYASAQIDQPSAAVYAQSADIKPFLLKPVAETTSSVVRSAESVAVGTQPPLIRSIVTTNLLSPVPGLLKAQLAPEDPTCRNLTQCDTPLPRPTSNGQPEIPVLRVLRESAQVPVAQAAEGVAGIAVAAPRSDTTIAVPKPIASEPATVNSTRVDNPPVLPLSVESRPAVNNPGPTDTLTSTKNNSGLEPKPLSGAPRADVLPAAPSGAPRVDVQTAAPSGAPRVDVQPLAPLGTQRVDLPPAAPLGTQRVDLPPAAPLGTQRVDLQPIAPVGSGSLRDSQNQILPPAVPRLEPAPANALNAPPTVVRTDIANSAVRDSIPPKDTPQSTQPPPRSAVIAQATTDASNIQVRQVAATWNDQLNRFNYSDVVPPSKSNQPTDRQPITTPNPVPGSPLPTTLGSDAPTTRAANTVPGATERQTSLPPLDTTNSRQNPGPETTPTSRNAQPIPGDLGITTRPGTSNPDYPQIAKPGQQTTADSQPTGKPGQVNPLEPTKPGLQNLVDSQIPRVSPGETRPGLDTTRNAPDSKTVAPGDQWQRNTPIATDGKSIDTAMRTGLTDPRGQDVTRPSVADPSRPAPLENPRSTVEGKPTDIPRAGQDVRTQDNIRIGADPRLQDSSKVGIDGRTPDASRPGIDGRTPDASRPGIDGRTPDASRPGIDGRTPDASRAAIDGRASDTSRPGLELRATEGQRSNTADGVNRAETNRIANDGITRQPEQKNEQLRGELRTDNQSGKFEASRAETGIRAGSEFPQQRANELRSDNLSAKTAETRTENIAVRSSEPRGETARLDAGTNRQSDSAPAKADIVTGRGDATNLKIDTASSRIDSAPSKIETGSARTDNPAAKLDSGAPRSENPAIKTDSSSVRTDIPSGKTDSNAARTDVPSIKTDSSAVRSDVPSVKTDSSAVRSDVPSVKTDSSAVRSDVPSVKTDSNAVRSENSASKLDGIAIKNESTNVKPENANIKNDSSLTSSPQNDSTSQRQHGSKPTDVSDPGKISDKAIINPDGAKPTPFGFPADIVATQKEAAAIRQVLNELKQNQNLSPSEVLELPSFKEAIRLLDALKSKDGDSNHEVKQHFTTSFVEAMRLSDFLKVLEKANEVQQKKLHKQQWAARSLAQTQHRVRYLVQREDTLESIAKKILGDVRFVQLLVTINRAEIIFTVVNGKSVSTVYEGQYLWIPTPNEVAIHRKHYFNANSAAVRGEPIAPEEPTPIRVEEYEAPTTVRDFATRLRPVTAPPVMTSQGPVSSPMALVLYRLRFAGNRNSVNLDEVSEEEESAQLSNRRHHKVRLGETLQSIAVNDELLKDVNMWVLICQINNLDTAVDVVGRPRAQIGRGDILLLPNQEEIEEFKLLRKLTEIAQLSGKELDLDLTRKPAPAKTSPHCRVDRKMSIEKLWERCRMILTDNDDTSYSIKLQRDTLEGRWVTVAAYESTNGKTVRWTYKIDGAKTCLEVGLPAAVSREMAIEDFQRNWRFYYNRYTAIKTDTLELLDLSEAAL